MVTLSLSRSFDRIKFYCPYKQFIYHKNYFYKQLIPFNLCLRIQFSNFLFSLRLDLLKIKGCIKKCTLRIEKVQQYFIDAHHKQLTGVGHGY